jgi:hypothetical protein
VQLDDPSGIPTAAPGELHVRSASCPGEHSRAALRARVSAYRKGGSGVQEGRLGGQAASSSDATLRVRFGSTRMPGPIVVETVIFRMYLPLELDGFSRSTSSRAAA